MPPQGSDDEPANQAACSRAPIAVAYRTGRPSRRPASIAGIHTHQSHQACRYSLTGNSWTGTYLAWVTFDDVTVGAEKEPASGLAIAEGGSGAATGGLIGGAVGAVGGVATTPSRGYYWYRYNGSGYYGPSYYGPGYGSVYCGPGY